MRSARRCGRLEDKSHVQVTIVPNPHIQTPEYSIRRLREDEAQLAENTQVSYQIPVAPAAVDPAEREKKAPAEPPAVAPLMPKTVAPVAPLAAANGAATSRALVPEVAQSGGFWKRMKRWFGTDDSAQAGVAQPATAQSDERAAAANSVRREAHTHGRRGSARGRDRRPGGGGRDEPRRERNRDGTRPDGTRRDGWRRDENRDEPRRASGGRDREPQRDPQREPLREQQREPMREPARELGRESEEAARRPEPQRDLEARTGAPPAADQQFERGEPGTEGPSDRPRGGRSRRGGRRRRRGGGGGGERREFSDQAGYESGDRAPIGNGRDGPERSDGGGGDSRGDGVGAEGGHDGNRDFGGPAHSSAPAQQRDFSPAAHDTESGHSEPPVHRADSEAPEPRPHIQWSSAPTAEPPATAESRHED